MEPNPTTFKVETIDDLEQIRNRYLAGEDIPDELIQAALRLARGSQITALGRKASQATEGSTAAKPAKGRKLTPSEAADLLGL
jgi:hypothetical protein